VTLDEFHTRGDAGYPGWIGMAQRVAEDPALEGTSFHPDVAGSFGEDEDSIEFARWCIAGGGMIRREGYIQEYNTLPEALSNLRRAAQVWVDPTEDRLPGAITHTVWMPDIATFPWRGPDSYPHVNYNAYLDMQFQYIATHPAFFGLGGVSYWRATYADEEEMRWVGRFLDHYGIEGRTSRASADPYLLEHIANPDFTEGLSGWTVEPAAEGSIEARSWEGYGMLRGTMLPRCNDTFALMRRSAERPNALSQTITGLQVGRLYSVKLTSADYGELQAGESREALHALSVDLDGCELIEKPFPGGSYPYEYAYPTRVNIAEFTVANPLYLNLRWQVFRATGTTATLRISDWRTPDDPGGPEGQELIVNFVEVKPFLED